MAWLSSLVRGTRHIIHAKLQFKAYMESGHVSKAENIHADGLHENTNKYIQLV